jgi:hypothetical protein
MPAAPADRVEVPSGREGKHCLPPSSTGPEDA